MDWICRRFWALFHWHRTDIPMYGMGKGDQLLTLSMWHRTWDEKKVEGLHASVEELKAIGWRISRLPLEWW